MTRSFAHIVYATLLLRRSFAVAQDVLTVCQQISDALSPDSDVFYARTSELCLFALAFSHLTRCDLPHSRAFVPRRHRALLYDEHH